jgi:hypothetical protein
MKTTSLKVGVFLLIAAVGADFLSGRRVSAGTADPPAANEKKPESKDAEGQLPVSPTFELPEIIREFERENPGKVEGLEESVQRWREFRREGKTMWGSEKWMKEPKYYEGLKTVELAKECFRDGIFATTVRSYLQPRFGFVALKEMHNGFAELFRRDDMGDGMLAVYEVLGSQIRTDTDLKTLVRVNLTLDALEALYREPEFKRQVKGREADFLKANVQVLRRYQRFLERFDPAKSESKTPFFREPIHVAQVALMLFKQVDPERYAALAPELMEIRWPPEQRLEDVKSFLDRVVAGIGDKGGAEPITSNTAASNQDKGGKKPAKARKLTEMEQKLVGTWKGDSSIMETPITFEKDGTFWHQTSTAILDAASAEIIRRSSSRGTKESGTWTLEGKRLTRRVKESGVKNRVGTVHTHEVVEVTDLKLVLESKEEDGRGKVTYTYIRPGKPGDGKPDPKGGRPDDLNVTAAHLHGYWESVEVTVAGGSSKLELRPDGKFLYAHRDVGTGWATLLGGAWELKGGRVVLTAEFRHHDGKDVEVGEKKTEELAATWKSGEWRLGRRDRPDLKKARNELAPADYLIHLTKARKTSQFYSPHFDGPVAAKVRETDLPKLVEMMASKDRCAATVRAGTAVVRAVGSPEGSTVGHEAAVLIDSFRLGKPYPIANSSTDHKVNRDALLRWWKERSERAKQSG